jgi:N-acetylmuramoyl-L-alanine amidase
LISPTQTRFAVTLLALAALLAPGKPVQAQTSTQQPPAPVVRSTPKPIHVATQSTPAQQPQASIGTPARKTAPGVQAPQGQQIITQSFPVEHKPATPKPTPAAPTPAPAKPAAAAPAHIRPSSRLPAIASTLPGAINRNVIVLDPAHGGVDSGSRISDSILEKDVSLALALKLRSLLTARGFNVIMTRDSDIPAGDTPPVAGAPAMLALDDRAGIVNHARASACLLLHATGSGMGVHLYNSELAPAPEEVEQLPWLTAQAAWVPQSEKLEKALATALTRARIPLVVSSASVRPVDSLTCPALVVELAPRTANDPATINDADYQQRIAEAIAASLIFWQNQVQPPARAGETSANDSAPETRMVPR